MKKKESLTDRLADILGAEPEKEKVVAKKRKIKRPKKKIDEKVEVIEDDDLEEEEAILPTPITGAY